MDEPRKLILKSELSPGDIMTMTAAVESLHATYPGQYLTDVRTPASEIWENNPHITKLEEDEAETIEVGYTSIDRCGQCNIPFLAGYTEGLGEKLGIPLRLTTNRPCLYLSDEEKGWTNQIQEVFSELQGRQEPFWLLDAGVKSDYTAKQWPLEYFQEVVDQTAGDILWVQVGSLEHDHVRIQGALDMIGRTDHRQLIRLAYHAEGGLGPVTYLQHLIAAWENPYLCLLGGREASTWVQYPIQHTFSCIGQLPCCRDNGCWKSRIVKRGDGDEKDDSLCRRPVLGLTRPVGKCMASIKPEEVLQVLRRVA